MQEFCKFCAVILMFSECCVYFVKQALLTFEDEQKLEAVRALRQTTELCKADYHKSRKSRRKHATDVLSCFIL